MNYCGRCGTSIKLNTVSKQNSNNGDDKLKNAVDYVINKKRFIQTELSERFNDSLKSHSEIRGHSLMNVTGKQRQFKDKKVIY
jgi:hypothetical protein